MDYGDTPLAKWNTPNGYRIFWKDSGMLDYTTTPDGGMIVSFVRPNTYANGTPTSRYVVSKKAHYWEQISVC